MLEVILQNPLIPSPTDFTQRFVSDILIIEIHHDELEVSGGELENAQRVRILESQLCASRNNFHEVQGKMTLGDFFKEWFSQ